MSRTEALEYTPVRSRQISEIRLDSGEVIIEYPLIVKPWIAAVARRLGGVRNKNKLKSYNWMQWEHPFGTWWMASAQYA